MKTQFAAVAAAAEHNECVVMEMRMAGDWGRERERDAY